MEKIWKVIDVSRWQGKIEWSKVKPQIDGCIIKLGGSDSATPYVDGKFSVNANECERLKIPYGVYWFMGENANVENDYNKIVETLKGRKPEFPIYIDVEVGRDKRKITDYVLALGDKLEKSGYYVGVYGSEISTFNDRVYDSELKRFDHWVANYSRKPQMVCGMWQKSSTRIISGIDGNTVDMNECYNWYPEIIHKYHLNGF